MAVEDLKKAIIEKIQKEKEAILNQARKEQNRIIREAKEKALSLHQSYLLEIKKRGLLKKTKKLSEINLEAKRQLLEAKEKKISEVLSKVEENLKVLSQARERFKSIFQRLLQESLNLMGKKEELKLKVNPLDKELALTLLKELKVEAQLETEKSIEGGLELCDLAENILIKNTFSSRLEKLKPELRLEVSEILFGKPQG